MKLSKKANNTVVDPKIDIIREALESQGFDVENAENGISVIINSTGGVSGGILDIYTLKKKPEHLRARLRRKSKKDGLSTEELEDLALHAATDLEYTRNLLEEALAGTATIGRFHYFGFKGDYYYYYADLALSREPCEEILRTMLAKKALEQLHGIDSKNFRQGLDSLGLPRSSIVRLALTRIFRGATDTTEFINAAALEAGRIVSAEEWKTVRELLDENRVSFLSNILYILWQEVSRCYMKKAWESLHN